MLVDKNYVIKITNRNKTRFLEKGYKVINGKSTVNVNDLNKGSHLKVDVICDRCDKLLERVYKSHLIYRKKYGYDTCNSCKYEKVGLTNMKRYGVSNPFQSEKIKEGIKKKNIRKYGVDNLAKLDEIKNKIKKTNRERYGVDCHLSLKYVREKISKTKSEKGNFYC